MEEAMPTLYIRSVEFEHRVSEFPRIKLELVGVNVDWGAITKYLQPGKVLSEFGIADEQDWKQGTKIKIPGVRKLCLD